MTAICATPENTTLCSRVRVFMNMNKENCGNWYLWCGKGLSTALRQEYSSSRFRNHVSADGCRVSDRATAAWSAQTLLSVLLRSIL